MSISDYADYDAIGLATLVRTGQVSAQELLGEAVRRAERANDKLNCFSALFLYIAREQIETGLPTSVLSGVPFATKDLSVAVNGASLTNGSVAYRGNIAT